MNSLVEGLIEAINSGRTDIVRSVVEACQGGEIPPTEEFDLNTLLNSSLTPDGTVLHVAVKANQVDIVRALLVAGANPSIHNKEDKTPFDVADSKDVVQVFHDQLLQCIAQADVELLNQLIVAGVSINFADTPTYNNSPLHWAACYGTKDIVECLCSNGALVNAKNNDDATALHDAVLRRELNIIQSLLSFGATSSINDKAKPGKRYDGKSPLELAYSKPEILKCLKGIHLDTKVTEMSSDSLVEQNGIQQDNMSETSSTTIGTEVMNNISFDSTLVAQVMPSEASMTPAVNQQNEENFPELKLPEHESSTKSDYLMQYIWPMPKKIIRKNGRHFKPSGGVLSVFLHNTAEPEGVTNVISTWKNHADNFKELDLEIAMEVMTGEQSIHFPHIIAELNRNLFTSNESYKLSVQHSQIKLQASDIAGLHYAITTLLQLFKFSGSDGIPNIQLHDYPDIRDRGVILDMSKGRIQKLEYMKNLIERFSLFKINQIHIYHRFCVPHDPNIKWQFSYPRSMMLELADYCTAHCIELIPVIDLTPRVTIEDLDILYSSFQSFLKCFTSASYVGVGPRLTSFLVDITDEGQLNLEDTERFLPIASHQTLQLCAFVFHNVPHMLNQYPCKMTVAEYGFQANYEFEKYGQTFEENGIPFYLVPGTAAWNSLSGCPEAAVKNIHNAVKIVNLHGGLGVTVSHWSGVSHLTHLPFMWTGVLTCAGLAWNSTIDMEFIHTNIAQLINHHILKDIAGIAGQVIIELGRAETYLLRCAQKQAGSDNSNLPAEKGSTLYQLLTHPDQVELSHLNIDVFQKTMRHIRKCQSELSKAVLHCKDSEVVLNELQVTADLMLTACRVGRQLVNAGKNPHQDMGSCSVVNLGVTNLSATTKTDLANRLLAQIETYRNVWLSRNLPHGLQDSMLILSTMLKQFVPEESITADQ